MRKTDVYPAAPRLDVVDVLHGHRVTDPYRWLEDPADERTVAWSRAQDELAADQLAALPGRDALAARMHALLDAGSVGAPLWRAGLRFWTRREPGQEHAVVLVRGSYGDERVLIDPMAIDPTGRTTDARRGVGVVGRDSRTQSLDRQNVLPSGSRPRVARAI